MRKVRRRGAWALLWALLLFGVWMQGAGEAMLLPSGSFAGVSETEESSSEPEATPIPPEETSALPEEALIPPTESPALPEGTPISPEETPALPEETPTPPEESSALPEETFVPPEDGHSVSPDEMLTPSPEGEFNPLSTEWNGGIIVGSYEELAVALSVDNGYNTIFFGADISGDYSGAPNIQIHNNKRNVVISGTDPRDGVRHTFTTKRGAAETYGIYVRSAAIQSVTFRDMDIIGLNYYGVCHVNDAAAYATASFTLNYINASYEGPQMAVTAYCTLRLEDFSYVSKQNGSNTGAVQEVGELRRLVLAGNVDIDHSGVAGHSMFWFRTNAAGAEERNSIVVEDGARVTITTSNYVIATDAYDVAMIVGKKASMTINTPAMMRNAAEEFKSITVQEEGALDIYQNTANTSYYTLRITDSLSVAPGGKLRVGRVGGSSALIRMDSSGASVTFDAPDYLYLYSPASQLFSFYASTPVALTADAINIWHNGGNTADSIDNMPTAIWNKDDTAEPVTFAATYTASAVLNGLSHNLTEGDPVLEPANAENLRLSTARQLVMGRYLLTGSAKISGAIGTTVPNAALQLRYDNAGQTVSGAADGAGAYTLNASLLEDENVIILSHHNLLKARKVTRVEFDPASGLYFSYVPPLLDFGAVTLSAGEQMVNRADPSWYISVYDGRGAGSAWRVTAHITGPLRSGDGMDTLPDALVMVDGSAITPLSASSEYLVYSGVTAGAAGSAAATTNIAWTNNQGPALRLYPGYGRAATSYATTIMWTLYDAP